MHGARFLGLQGNQSAAFGACMSVARSLPGNLRQNPGGREGQESFANAGRAGEGRAAAGRFHHFMQRWRGPTPGLGTMLCYDSRPRPLFYHCLLRSSCASPGVSGAGSFGPEKSSSLGAIPICQTWRRIEPENLHPGLRLKSLRRQDLVILVLCSAFGPFVSAN